MNETEPRTLNWKTQISAPLVLDSALTGLEEDGWEIFQISPYEYQKGYLTQVYIVAKRVDESTGLAEQLGLK